MAKLTIWSAGVKIYPLDGSDETPTMKDPESIPAKEKFDTCEHRSNFEKRIIRNCCSSKPVEGYGCRRLPIFPLGEEDCKKCKLYEAKRK